MKVIYIAGPFRGRNAWEVECNVRRAECLGFEVAQKGAMPLIPHTNTRFFNGTLNDEFWLDGTQELLRRCDALLTVEGWEASQGAQGEVQLACELDLPVFHELWALNKWLRIESTRDALDRSPREEKPKPNWRNNR
jgi:hypothetical protein